MINLLPSQQKEEILQEEKKRLISILGILILIFLICLALILFSIKIFISSQVGIQKTILNQREKELEVSRIQSLEEEIKTNNAILLKLNSFYQKQINLLEVLEKIVITLPSEIYLTNLSFNKTQDEESFSQISLSGSAPTREILLEFKQNLESEEIFKEPSFPPSTWVEPTDINFSVNFIVSKNDSKK